MRLFDQTKTNEIFTEAAMRGCTAASFAGSEYSFRRADLLCPSLELYFHRDLEYLTVAVNSWDDGAVNFVADGDIDYETEEDLMKPSWWKAAVLEELAAQVKDLWPREADQLRRAAHFLRPS